MKAIALLSLGLGAASVAAITCNSDERCISEFFCGNDDLTQAQKNAVCDEFGITYDPITGCQRAFEVAGPGDCGNSQGLVTSVCCQPAGSGGNDPWLTGINGQRFLFDGEDGKWYSLIHDPSRLNLNMRIYSPLENDPTTFFNGVGITVYDGHEEHRISLTTKDAKNFHPECPEGEICIANGAIEVEIDGVKITNPGHHALGEVIDFAIVNAPWDCKNIPKAHQEWDKVQIAMDKKMEKKGRRLSIFDPKEHVLESIKHQFVFDADKCAAWRKERQEKKDVFQVKGEHATMFLSVDDFAIQLEFTLNTDPRWIDHQRFDVVVSGPIAKDPKQVSGVLGETATLKYDSILKTPIKEGRDVVLSGPDSDYEVAGPFGTEFKARKHTDLRKLF